MAHRGAELHISRNDGGHGFDEWPRSVDDLATLPGLLSALWSVADIRAMREQMLTNPPTSRATRRLTQQGDNLRYEMTQRWDGGHDCAYGGPGGGRVNSS